MGVFTVGVTRGFRAFHFLFGGDWGRENQHHSHDYRLEAVFEGDKLDQHGYLLDIALVKVALDGLLARYEDRTLNELDEFSGKNPSLEHFAHILADRLAAALGPGDLSALMVRLWEDSEAYASTRIAFR